MLPKPDISLVLTSVHEALKLTHREWLLPGAPVGLSIALHGACLLALTGYDTARPEDLAHPTDSARFAPLQLLMRRVRSAEYLQAPELLNVSRGELRALDDLRTWRNGVVHAHQIDVPEEAEMCLSVAVRIIRYLVLDHPSFSAAGQGVVLTLIDHELAALSPRD